MNMTFEPNPLYRRTVKLAILVGVAVVAYKTSKKQVIASAYTVGSIGKEASSYVRKHYKSHYKNL